MTKRTKYKRDRTTSPKHHDPRIPIANKPPKYLCFLSAPLGSLQREITWECLCFQSRLELVYPSSSPKARFPHFPVTVLASLFRVYDGLCCRAVVECAGLAGERPDDVTDRAIDLAIICAPLNCSKPTMSRMLTRVRGSSWQPRLQ